MILFKRYIKEFLGLSPKVRRDIKINSEFHGSAYGGWTIASEMLNADSIVLSFGVGHDISFDLSLIKKYQVYIQAFDPTPQVGDWLDNQTLPELFVYHCCGIASSDGLVKFFLPEKAGHISHSISPTSEQDCRFIQVPVKSFVSICTSLNFKFVDLLKMDIEGFEYSVIPGILDSGVEVKQLLIEFHHGMYGFSNQDTLDAIAKLRKAGYKLFSISDTGRELSFRLE